jgi:hypothetical protein
MAENMSVQVLLGNNDVCGLVGKYQRFRETYSHLSALTRDWVNYFFFESKLSSTK